MNLYVITMSLAMCLYGGSHVCLTIEQCFSLLSNTDQCMCIAFIV